MTLPLIIVASVTYLLGRVLCLLKTRYATATIRALPTLATAGGLANMFEYESFPTRLVGFAGRILIHSIASAPANLNVGEEGLILMPVDE